MDLWCGYTDLGLSFRVEHIKVGVFIGIIMIIIFHIPHTSSVCHLIKSSSKNISEMYININVGSGVVIVGQKYTGKTTLANHLAAVTLINKLGLTSGRFDETIFFDGHNQSRDEFNVIVERILYEKETECERLLVVDEFIRTLDNNKFHQLWHNRKTCRITIILACSSNINLPRCVTKNSSDFMFFFQTTGQLNSRVFDGEITSKVKNSIKKLKTYEALMLNCRDNTLRVYNSNKSKESSH